VESGADPQARGFKKTDAFSEATKKKQVAQNAKGWRAHWSVRTLELASLLLLANDVIGKHAVKL
jgi:hypothetical protein